MTASNQALYVLVHKDGRTHLGEGPLLRSRTLDGLPSPGALPVISLVQLCQIRERGFSAHDGGEEILSLVPEQWREVEFAELAQRAVSTNMVASSALEFEVDDRVFAETVQKIIDQEVCRGQGANFLISRRGRLTATGLSDGSMVAFFLRLVEDKPHAYMSFLFFDGQRYFVTASPERHRTVLGGEATMGPICGTLPKSDASGRAELIEFLTDPKEINELFQVVDEQLKVMWRICVQCRRVSGPFLQEMATVIHTAHELAGITRMTAIEAFRESMFAATMVGSPLESAARVITKYEWESRGYYSSSLMVRTRGAAGDENLDSTITIRMTEVMPDGSVTQQSGVTVVRDSDADTEVAEVRAKMRGQVDALERISSLPAVLPELVDDRVRDILKSRNKHLSKFWVSCQPSSHPAEDGWRDILVVNNEDQFTYMLAHPLRSLGTDRNGGTGRELLKTFWSGTWSWSDPAPVTRWTWSGRRFRRLHESVQRLLVANHPFIAVCWHTRSSARSSASGSKRSTHPDRVSKVATIADSKRVVTLRAPSFVSFQFHLESILTRNSIPILREAIAWL